MNFFGPIYDFLHSRGGAALLVTLLLIGLWNMFRNPPANLSQRLMRWRVGLQFGVLCLIFLVLFLKR